MASATGHSIQQAEMNAAKQALENSKGLFPQLDHQKRVIARSMRKQRVPVGGDDNKDRRNDRRNNSSDDESSKLPMQYRKRANVPTDDSDEKRNDSDQSSARAVKSQSTSKLTPSAKKRNKRKRKRTISASSPKIRVTPPNAPSNSQKIEYYSPLSDDSLASVDENEDLPWIKSDIKQMEKDLCELDDGTTNYAAVAFMKVQGTEDLSSDVESGEII